MVKIWDFNRLVTHDKDVIMRDIRENYQFVILDCEPGHTFVRPMNIQLEAARQNDLWGT